MQDALRRPYPIAAQLLSGESSSNFILQEEILIKPQEVRDLKPIQKSVKALHA
jgi:hypothetical protein